jgi:Transposase zinc-ribbon domain
MACNCKNGTEEQCRAIVVSARWPRGFECPACGGKQYSLVTTRNLYQCSKCRRADVRDCGDDLCLVRKPTVSESRFNGWHRHGEECAT